MTGVPISMLRSGNIIKRHRCPQGARERFIDVTGAGGLLLVFVFLILRSSEEFAEELDDNIE